MELSDDEIRGECTDRLIVLVHAAPAVEVRGQIEVDEANIPRALEAETGEPLADFRMSADDDIRIEFLYPVREAGLTGGVKVEQGNGIF